MRRPTPEEVFNEENLTANRRGTMTFGQVKPLRWPLWTAVIIRWVVLLALYGGGVYAYYYFQLVVPEQFMYGVLGLAALIVIMLAWLTKRRLGSISRREVDSVGGEISRFVRDAGKGKAVHEIAVEKYHFVVRPEVYEAFDNGQFYRIYYQPKLKLLLTAEKV